MLGSEKREGEGKRRNKGMGERSSCVAGWSKVQQQDLVKGKPWHLLLQVSDVRKLGGKAKDAERD